MALPGFQPTFCGATERAKLRSRRGHFGLHPGGVRNGALACRIEPLQRAVWLNRELPRAADSFPSSVTLVRRPVFLRVFRRVCSAAIVAVGRFNQAPF